jgi:hypothetical protein
MKWLAVAVASGLSAAAFAQGDISGIWQLRAPLPVLGTTTGKAPPLTAAGRKLYADRRAHQEVDPATLCKPLGEPRAMLQDAGPFQILQSAGRIDIAYQWNRLVHTIPMKAAHGPVQGPFYFGESIGRWDGDTLIVDVLNVRDESWLDLSGLPHSSDIHLVERFRTIDDGSKLEVRLRFEDPEFCSTPRQARLVFERRSQPLVEDICVERLKLDIYGTLGNAVRK